jgi:dynactin complex subunit
LAMHTFNNTEADTKLLNENTELTRQVKANTDTLEEIRRNLNALCALMKLDPDGSTPAST